MSLLSRRTFLGGLASISASTLISPAKLKANHDQMSDLKHDEILGQGNFKYRVNRYWGRLERSQHPVNDCHGIIEDAAGRILLLTNNTQNNIIAYSKKGEFLTSWEHRFPAAHALRIENVKGSERYWITDHSICTISLCDPSGKEIRRIGPDAVAHKYPDITKYHPTNVAFMPDGDFYVSDGYGSHYIHHFDPDWKLISTFGGAGTKPSNLKTPHSVWLDTRTTKPRLLICDRANAKLKWFSLSGELEQVVPLPGTEPSNISEYNGYLAIASLNGMILILDKDNKVVSVVGGEAPSYVDGKLQPIVPYNYTFIHPHDVYIDQNADLYVAQWNSYKTYPIKLERIAS